MIYSLETAAERLSEFDKLLAQYGIAYDKNKIYYRSAYRVLEMLEAHKKKIELNEHEDIRPLIREAIGLNDFLVKILSVKDLANFKLLIPHLRKIAKGSLAQTVSATFKDQDAVSVHHSNKLFELYLACLALPEFDNLVLDDPDNAKGNNPDLLFDVNGRNWGIAAKVLHTEGIKPESIYKNWDKGSDQIEKSSADRGLVIISLRNIIEYDELWPVTNPKEVNEGEIRDTVLLRTLTVLPIYFTNTET